MGSKKVFPEGLLGRKVGMTQIFLEDGSMVPVTVIEAGPCTVLEVKSADKHGYSGVQLGFGPKKMQRVSKGLKGHVAKAGQGGFYHIREIRCDAEKLQWNVQGKQLGVADVFAQGQFVDVTGLSKGRGFAGVVKKWNAGGFPATRGTHEYRRHIGAIGCRKFPHHVFKNKHMPGHFGDEQVTVQNLKVVAVKGEENLLLVRGGMPGPKGAMVLVRKAIKGFVAAA
jgi:large subunit ribosomal protein L3